jgi:DNA-binding response OmpR family regulator
MMKVLVADDDEDLLDLVGYALRREGHEVVTAADGRQALTQWREQRPDLVLLDATLPRLEADEVCRRIRRGSDTGVIVLGPRGDDSVPAWFLRAGADDYVVKPFSFRVLSARIAAVRRRYQSEPGALPARDAEVVGLSLDPSTRLAVWLGERVPLTRVEFRLLSLLAANAGRIVPFPRLIQHAFGRYTEAHRHLLRSHMSHIRKKLRLGATRGSLEAVRGAGYRLDLAPPQQR